MFDKIREKTRNLIRGGAWSGPVPSNPILPLKAQSAAWRKADRRMKWGMPGEDFDRILSAPDLSVEERADGFIGHILCYGFGCSTDGASDAVLSGRLAWEYACNRRRGRVWQCEYAGFERPDDIRIRPEAPPRPRGFYHALFSPGVENQLKTVSGFRKQLRNGTGLGPEGFQLPGVTHPHLLDLMNERRFPFIALADYDIAPHGFNDFHESSQLFCSQNVFNQTSKYRREYEFEVTPCLMSNTHQRSLASLYFPKNQKFLN